MNIGIMGAPIDNGNLGCMALTYSLLCSLEDIAKETGDNFNYFIFDGTNNQNKINELSDNLKIPRERIHSMRPGYLVFNRTKEFLRKVPQDIKLLYGILKCDCVIDVTVGDSFTDIYGVEVFQQRTNTKLLLSWMHKPYILAPQTYGPYRKQSEEKAAKAMKGADIVMARDGLSLKVAQNLSKRDVLLIDDLAFQLPYEKREKYNGNLIAVGINVSGLLWSKKSERTTSDFEIKVDYDEYVFEICRYLSSNAQYKAYFVPHVEIDHEIHSLLHEKFPQIEVVPPFANPVEAKSFISGLDIFIGARMHGTIAAFSSGVACIPTGYSRKFVGLFETLGYFRTIDLQEMSTAQAIERTLSEIIAYRQLQDEGVECMKGVEERKSLFHKTVRKWIEGIRRNKSKSTRGARLK